MSNFLTGQEPLAQCAVLIYMLKTMSGRLQELKNIRKVQLGNPNSVHGRLRERSLTRGFHYRV